MIVRRSIAPSLAPQGPARVKIVEGARAVGKTTMARGLFNDGVYESFNTLVDPITLQNASSDPLGWLRALPNHSIIDEAQLVPELTLFIKQLVDDPHEDYRFLLTGSASIGRTALGGSDPLTGRAQRWRVRPFSRAELEGEPERMEKLVPALFGALPEREREIARSQITSSSTIFRGGFPLLALEKVTDIETDRWVRETIIGLLTDHVLPGERFDSLGALRVLDSCLLLSGEVLNVTSMAQRIGLDPRTVDRYLDVLERRFLLSFLPNLKTQGIRRTRSRSKIVPVDIAFAVEAMRRADPAVLRDNGVVGHLFEGYVFHHCQVAVDLCPKPVGMYYWRTSNGRKEVDIVLVGSSGKRVGIEVKAGETIRPDVANGLKALAEEPNFHAGYIVYNGNRVIRLSDNIWALPLDVFLDANW